jgi:uncharacterized protein YdhG (YjbR/CyaY superfamily)
MITKPKDVKDYISTAPKEARNKLTEIRRVIRKCAPRAVEKISYGMPYYDYRGRLAYFRLARTHIGIYIPPPVIERYKKELKKYKITKATIRISLNDKVPVEVIKKLIKTRMKINEKK